MNLKNYKGYAAFNYFKNTYKCSHHKLGDVVLKNDNGDIQIGVIIQIHEEGEYRTDMFGNCSLSEIKMASNREIKKFRPDIKNEGKWSIKAAQDIIKEITYSTENLRNYNIKEHTMYVESKLRDVSQILDKHI